MICELGKIKNVVFDNRNKNIPYYIFVNRANPTILTQVNEAMILFKSLDQDVKNSILEKISNGTIKETIVEYCFPSDIIPTTKNGNTSIEVSDVKIFANTTSVVLNNDLDIDDMLCTVLKELKEIFINSKELLNIAEKKEQEVIYLYLARKLFTEKLKEETSNKILTILTVNINISWR